VLRAGWGSPDINFVHINEVKGLTECAARLVTFEIYALPLGQGSAREQSTLVWRRPNLLI